MHCAVAETLASTSLKPHAASVFDVALLRTPAPLPSTISVSRDALALPLCSSSVPMSLTCHLPRSREAVVSGPCMPTSVSHSPKCRPQSDRQRQLRRGVHVMTLRERDAVRLRPRPCHVWESVRPPSIGHIRPLHTTACPFTSPPCENPRPLPFKPILPKPHSSAVPVGHLYRMRSAPHSPCAVSHGASDTLHPPDGIAHSLRCPQDSTR